MSEAAKIILIGSDKESLIKTIEEIKKWDSGNNYPIQVFTGEDYLPVYDSIENVHRAIQSDLDEYIVKKRIEGGNSNELIRSLESFSASAKYAAISIKELSKTVNEFHVPKKERFKRTNITPKKKKRKK